MTKAMDEEGAWLGTVIAASDIGVRSEAAARLSHRLADMHGRIAALEQGRSEERARWVAEMKDQQQTWRRRESVMLEEHRKALVRARNEGLEKAAEWARVNTENGEANALVLRLMKEPEE